MKIMSDTVKRDLIMDFCLKSKDKQQGGIEISPEIRLAINVTI